MKNTLKICLISSALALTATAATADPGYYYGIGLAYSAADSESGPGGGSFSDASGAAVGLTFGYRFENATAFYGPELNADLFISGDFAESISGVECSAGALVPIIANARPPSGYAAFRAKAWPTGWNGLVRWVWV